MPGQHRASRSARTSPPISGRARRPTRASPVGGFGVAFLVAALVAGSATYLQLEKRVTLVVDGRTQLVRTFDSTVADLLARAGVDLGPHDRVDPEPDAALAEGLRVHVRLAREITLVLNGSRRVIWVTGGKTVADVLQLVDVRATPEAHVEPSPGDTVGDGDTIVFQEAVSVRVTVGGKPRQVITNATDVASLLDSMGVVVEGRDRVHPSTRTDLRQGLRIEVVRVDVRREVVTEAVPFGVQVEYSEEMYQGEETVTRPGTEGLRRTVYRVRAENGEEMSRTVVRTKVIQEPVSQVVVRGTKPPTFQTGQATWYHRDGMVAAHPTLPFGTEVKVTNLANGSSVTVVINDRGPFGAGRIIDLSDDAFAEIAPLGAGVIDVRISW